MRFLTTLVLVILVAAGAALWWQWDTVAPRLGLAQTAHDERSDTAAELAKITPAALTRIELNDVRLDRTGQVWNLPGDWPTRSAEVERLIALLTSLESRFAPLPWTAPEEFGMAAGQSPVTVRLVAGGRNDTLTFGEPVEGTHRFIRPTYLRLDDRPEVLRLAPGTIDQLRKTRDDFLRRQLFPEVVRVKLADANRPALGAENELSPPAVALINARELSVSGPDGAWTLKASRPVVDKKLETPMPSTAEKLAGRYTLTTPVADRVDPDKLRGVLAAVPDLWAEAFVTETDPTKTGLDKPERTVTVKTAERELQVQIGAVSRVKETKSPAPPPANPFAPPPPPPIPVREEYRFAKLPTNPQVFEVRTDRFADLFVKASDLRDPKLARFRPGDVKRLELVLADRKLAFALEKDGGEEKWKIVEPVTAPADAPRVTELIDKLADLQARGLDVLDTPDLKVYGLGDGDKPTTATLTLTEEERTDTPDAPKTTTTRTVTYRLGRLDAAKAKLFVQVLGIARVDAVPDDVLKLVNRPVLAYRSRRVIDVPARQLAKIAIERPGDPYTLAQVDGVWSLASPVTAKADVGKANSLAGDLARLDAAEFINFAPSPDDLKKYGLDNPTLKVALKFADGTAKTLLFGAAREGKPEVYAKLADGPEVFAVRAQVKDTADQPSLALRPLQLWQVAGIQVQAIEVQHAGEKFTLSRDGAFWKVAGPFAATAFLPGVQPLLDAGSAPRAERLEAHAADDLAKYGLDKPFAVLRVTLKAERPDDPSGVKEIQLGKPVAEGQPARFARLADQPGVFVLGANITEAAAKPALDLLDRRLLSLDTRQITKVEGGGPGGTWSARRDGEKWVIDSLNPPAAGDRTVLDSLVNVWGELRAQKFAAYAPADWAKFGLDKPNTVTVTVAAGDKPVTHIIALGNPADGNPQARYARVDNGPAVAILGSAAATELSRSALDLVDRGVFAFDAKALTGIRRQAGEQELLIEKKDGTWKLAKPQPAAADEPALAEMAERLAGLRAVRVAALAAKDLKPFGLDAPAAVFTLSLPESAGQPRALTLKIGGPTDGGRFAQTTTDTVYVLPDSGADPLATRLLADPLKFRDRALAHFTDADRVTASRTGRAATFARMDGFWKMTAPLSVEAESGELDELVLAVGRLRADELVAEKPADLAPYGLDKPQAELRFMQGDNEVLHLLVGKREADGRAFVKLANGDLVAKLDSGLSGRVLAEYRKRSLWANLDAAQADTVVINAGAGGTPTILRKSDAGWQAPDHPDQRVNAEAVNELLAAMAGMKAERYVADQKADLKLYGLEPPVRVIVVTTRGGPATTLHLGRFEGESKKVYATVPGADGAVVVLSEADSAKLLKPMAELLKK